MAEGSVPTGQGVDSGHCTAATPRGLHLHPQDGQGSASLHADTGRAVLPPNSLSGLTSLEEGKGRSSSQDHGSASACSAQELPDGIGFENGEGPDGRSQQAGHHQSRMGQGAGWEAVVDVPNMGCGSQEGDPAPSQDATSSGSRKSSSSSHPSSMRKQSKRFHATRPLAAQYQGQSVCFMMETAHRDKMPRPCTRLSWSSPTACCSI